MPKISRLDEWLPKRTNDLDAAKNTTAAVGNCLAVGLFGTFCVQTTIPRLDILHPWGLHGLFTMLQVEFAALTTAANEMVKECMKQSPKIIL